MATVIKLIDSNTSELVSYEQTDVWFDGTAMDDSKLDPAIYRKAGGVYYKRAIKDGIIDVKWFGAIGDGTTDDTQALQAAFNIISGSWVSTKKLSLSLGYGVYSISSPLVLNNGNVNTVIRGNGIRYTTIRAAVPMASMIQLGKVDDSFTGRNYIKDISFNLGGAWDGTNATVNAVLGIDATNIRYSEISSCEFLNIPQGGWGIKINHWVNNIYRNEMSSITGMPEAGGILIPLDSAVNNLVIDNNSLHNLTYGIRCDSPAALLNITYNTIDNCTAYGIYLSSGTRKVNIENNYFERCGKDGFEINKGSGNTDIWYGAILAHHNISAVSYRLDGLTIAKNQFANCGLPTEGCMTLSSVEYVSIYENQNYLANTNDSFVHLKWLGCPYGTCKELFISVDPYNTTQFNQIIKLDTDSNTTNTSNIRILQKNTIPHVRSGLNALLNPLKIPSSSNEWTSFYNVNGPDGKEAFVISAGSTPSRKIKTFDLNTTNSPFKGGYFRLNYLTKGQSGFYFEIKIDGVSSYLFNSIGGDDYTTVGRNQLIYIPTTAQQLSFEFTVTNTSYETYVSNFALVPAYYSLDASTGNDDPLLNGGDLYGGGSPEGLVAAPKGTIYRRVDNGLLYLKTSVKTLNTGWHQLEQTATTTSKGVVNQSAAQSDSTATDITGIVSDFNALLAKLRTSGQLAT